ncbi:MAG TPA: hypothetical protein VFH83_15890 [Spirochaetia bacterium]|nr:hypothetical protein [Spirochaetia bacterium]
MKPFTVGLLPLYIKLYDDLDKDGAWRGRMETFPGAVAHALEKRGVQVERAPICRLAREFAAAVKSLETRSVDALVTLHLAYSPSLESAAVLAKTRLPLIVLDATPTWSYSPRQDPAELMFNHGIHGVQDMCNLLIRNGKPFLIEAGHWERSDVLDRVAAWLPAARMASTMRRAKVGLIGTAFKGMGDFQVTPTALASTIGASVKSLEPEKFKRLLASVNGDAVGAEMKADRERFRDAGVSAEAHERSVKMGLAIFERSEKMGLAIRRWIEQEGLTALSFNFQSMVEKDGYPTAPFLEMSKAMERGIGYAGEGDTLTATLVGGLMASFQDTSFTEMFCPDWENNTVFLSHMGEANLRLLDGPPQLREMKYQFSKTRNPALATGCFKPGEVTLVNLAPLGGGRYRLIVAPVEMVPVTGPDRMEESIRGWFRPPVSVADFLAGYSRLGGTHHLAVSYTRDLASLEGLAGMMGWEHARLG